MYVHVRMYAHSIIYTMDSEPLSIYLVVTVLFRLDIIIHVHVYIYIYNVPIIMGSEAVQDIPEAVHSTTEGSRVN